MMLDNYSGFLLSVDASKSADAAMKAAEILEVHHFIMAIRGVISWR